MKKLEAIVRIANDLTAVLDDEDRYSRLLEALRIAIPYDAATLLRIEEDVLVPIAARGLSPQVMGMVFPRREHPRLDIICGSKEPVQFSRDSSLPDPFDGMLIGSEHMLDHIHACLGCPLSVRGELVGVLVFDALNPDAFENLPKQYIEVVGALAGAQWQTVKFLDVLEQEAERQGKLTLDLMRDIQQQRGWEILGTSKAINSLRSEIELVARSDFTILILGETGVGKELVARAVHGHSGRSSKPLLYLNCAALPDSLAESELFGHVRGAFTGATADRTGKFELADGGTLFLDEIGELSLEIQAKLLRAIQEGEVQRIGSEKMIKVDVRLLAATNRDLEEEVGGGRFRADLFHRLNVYPVNVAPLRDRKEDIAILAGFFADRARNRLGSGQVRISEDALELLMGYSWPGNVRELDNVISRAVLKASGNHFSASTLVILPVHLSGDIGNVRTGDDKSFNKVAEEVSSRVSMKDALKVYQIRLIENAVSRNRGNWAAAARELGLHRSNLHNLAARLGIR